MSQPGTTEDYDMGEISSSIDSLLDEYDVARIRKQSVASVRRDRLLKKGPKYLKIGSAVRYRPEDVAAWLESRPSGGGHSEAQ